MLQLDGFSDVVYHKTLTETLYRHLDITGPDVRITIPLQTRQRGMNFKWCF